MTYSHKRLARRPVTPRRRTRMLRRTRMSAFTCWAILAALTLSGILFACTPAGTATGTATAPAPSLQSAPSAVQADDTPAASAEKDPRDSLPVEDVAQSDTATEDDDPNTSASVEATEDESPSNVATPTEGTIDETPAPREKTVVCIGDSITSGHVPTYSEPDPWPTFLQQMLYRLHDNWNLVNLGVTDTTLLDEGACPYRDTGNIEYAKQIGYDVAIIMLGTNDSWDSSWNASLFQSELKAMVDELYAAQPDSRIVLMAPPSAFCDPDPNGSGVFHMNDAVIGGQILPIMQEVAAATDSQFVDLHQFTAGHPEWFPDTVHPNGEGNRAIAAYIFDAVFA